MSGKSESILQSALELFVIKGFHGTATSVIAEKAGVSNGTLFHHFKSKESLIQHLHQQVKSEQIAYIRQGLDKVVQPKEKVHLIWSQAIQWAMNNKDKYKFLHQYKYSPYRKKHRPDVETFKKEFHDIVEKGIQVKDFRYLPYDFVFDMSNAHVHGMVEYLSANPIKFRTPEFMKQAFESFMDSVRP